MAAPEPGPQSQYEAQRIVATHGRALLERFHHEATPRELAGLRRVVAKLYEIPREKLQRSIVDAQASERAFKAKALAARTTHEMHALRDREIWWRQRAALRQMVLDAGPDSAR